LSWTEAHTGVEVSSLTMRGSAALMNAVGLHTEAGDLALNGWSTTEIATYHHAQQQVNEAAANHYNASFETSVLKDLGAHKFKTREDQHREIERLNLNLALAGFEPQVRALPKTSPESVKVTEAIAKVRQAFRDPSLPLRGDQARLAIAKINSEIQRMTKSSSKLAGHSISPARQGLPLDWNQVQVAHAGFDAPVMALIAAVKDRFFSPQVKVSGALPRTQLPVQVVEVAEVRPPQEVSRGQGQRQNLPVNKGPKTVHKPALPAAVVTQENKEAKAGPKEVEPPDAEAQRNARQDAEHQEALKEFARDFLKQQKEDDERRATQLVTIGSGDLDMFDPEVISQMWARKERSQLTHFNGRPISVDPWTGYVRYTDESPEGSSSGTPLPKSIPEPTTTGQVQDGQGRRVLESGLIRRGPQEDSRNVSSIPQAATLPPSDPSAVVEGSQANPVTGTLGPIDLGLLPSRPITDIFTGGFWQMAPAVMTLQSTGEPLPGSPATAVLLSQQDQKERGVPPIERANTMAQILGVEQSQENREVPLVKPRGEDVSKKSVAEIIDGGQVVEDRSASAKRDGREMAKGSVEQILTGTESVTAAGAISPKGAVISPERMPAPLVEGEQKARVERPVRKNAKAVSVRPAERSLRQDTGKGVPSDKTSKEKSGESLSRLSSARQGEVFFSGSGQAVVNPVGPITLRVPFKADNVTYAVKSGDVVKKGALLVRASDTERENKIRFLETRMQEVGAKIAEGERDRETLDRDTLLKYRFDRTELELELFRFRAEQSADALFSPRPALVQTLPLGPATDGGYAIQIVPLDEGMIKIKLPPRYSSASAVALSVNGKRVTVLDWEASGFDLAEGKEGEFTLTLHFVSPTPVTPGNKEAPAQYAIELLNGDPRSVEAARINQETGFHTLVPPSQFTPVGVSPVPGVGAGVFHASVRDGQIVQVGEILGEVSIPAVHAEETRKAMELSRRASDFRRANSDFNTLPESTLQDLDARAARARAGLERNGSPILIKAPVSGRVQGMTGLDGQMLPLGRMTEAGIVNDEIFLGTSVDPRSKEWTGRLVSSDPYLIPVKHGTLKRGDQVSILTTHGVLAGTVYAVTPLANNGFELFTTLDGIVLSVVDKEGLLGEGSAVDIFFDKGANALEWARKGHSVPERSNPPLRFQDEIPAAIREELQMHPGRKIGVLRMLQLAKSEQNIQQRFAILRYFSGAFGFRYLGWVAAILIAGALAVITIPNLLFWFVKHRSHKNFFRQEMVESLQELRAEMDKIEMSLNRKAVNRNIEASLDPDKKVVREIVEPIQDWIRLLWEHENLGSDEYATILTKAGELTGNEFLRFSQEHFEDLGGQWKNDTRYQVKIRGILTRLSILSGRMAVAHLRQMNADQSEVDFREFLRFEEKITGFAENFNEGYNLAHRLIALSQVIELYPPKLVRGRSPLKFSEWLDIVKNRMVIWTFPVLRFFLGVSVMVIINRWVALRNAKKVFVNTHELRVFGFTSVEEAMQTAQKGLDRAFHPKALVDEVEGNKLFAYYGRWLGRVLVLTGVVIAIQAPLIFAFFGLTTFVAQGFGLVLQLLVPTIAIWRHVGPMLMRLSGEGYGVWKGQIRSLRRAAKQINRKLPKTSVFDDSQEEASVSSPVADFSKDEIPGSAATLEEVEAFLSSVRDKQPKDQAAAQAMASFFDRILSEAETIGDPVEQAKRIKLVEQFLGNRSEMRGQDLLAQIARRALEKHANSIPELEKYAPRHPKTFAVQESVKADLPERQRSAAARTNTVFPSPSVKPEPEDEKLIMMKIREALLDDTLRESVEIVVLLPPQNGENKRFFEEMVSRDRILQRFRFRVAESDGLFPGTAGQVFAAKSLAQSPEKKIKIYWFPKSEVPFPVAMSLFTANLGEAMRMAGDFKMRGMQYGEILFPGGDLSSNIMHYSKNGSNIVIDARLASFAEVQKRRYPVLLGRNGSPRHKVEHVVRRPEELQGALSQYGYDTGVGLTTRNTVLLQFPVPKGPLALVSNNEEEHRQMQALLEAFLKRTEELTERYGAFWVDFVEDFAGVIAEFHRQLKENNSVPPSLERLVHQQKKFPDGQNTANPLGKIYQAIGQKLWASYTEQQEIPHVESFIPPPTALFFVPGDDLPQIIQQLEHMEKKYPELVNAVALEKLKHGNVPDDERREFLFRYASTGEVVKLPRKMGHERKFAPLVSAAFITQEGKLLFQRRSRLASSNPGLLDLPVVEQREEGETPEVTIRRGFKEELFNGRPLPPSLSVLSFQAVADTSYEVQHERRRQVPGMIKEEASVFLTSLPSGFLLDDFSPGDSAVEVVSYTSEEVEKMYAEQHGVFTPRTYAMLKQFFPRIKEAVAHSDHGSLQVRSEIRTAAPVSGRAWSAGPSSKEPVRVAVRHGSSKEVQNKQPSPSLSTPLPSQKTSGHRERSPIPSKKSAAAAVPRTALTRVEETSEQGVEEVIREKSPAVPDEVRILAAIVVAEKILAVHDAGLLSRLEASLEDAGAVSERVAPALATLAGAHEIPVEVLKVRLEFLLRQEQVQNPADDRVVFLDAGTVPAEYFRKLMDAPVPVVILFDRRHKTLYEQVSKERPHLKKPDNVFPIYTPDGVSSFIRSSLQSGTPLLSASPRLNDILTRFRTQGKAEDIALITSNRAESQKIEQEYVGHRYYFTGETLRLDPELVGYSLALLLRSPELFRYGKGRYAQDVVSLLGLVLQQLAQEFQASLKTGSAA
jgi:hypothetical protein